MSPADTQGKRPIRSFVLRQGRITMAQNAALETLWPVFGLDHGVVFNQLAVFGRVAPLVLEIGFGNGESLAQMAAAAPEMDFVGIEVHRPGVGHLLLQVQDLGLNNVRVYCADAVEVLRHRIPPSSLDRVQIFFPDPWHKKRHHKRRLINAEFAALLSEKLKPSGVVHCATDWQDYAEQMLQVFEGSGQFRNQSAPGGFSIRPETRPETKFETRGQRLGHGVWDVLLEKI